jgi:hypothetical protein
MLDGAPAYFLDGILPLKACRARIKLTAASGAGPLAPSLTRNNDGADQK